MPYLVSKMDGEHDDNCPDPFNVRRLYIRIYIPSDKFHERGKQKLAPYGITCLGCNKIIKEYQVSKPILKQVVLYKLKKLRRERQKLKESGFENIISKSKRKKKKRVK